MNIKMKSQGTAIFMAMLIIAIVASIAVLLTRMQQIHIRRTQMMLTSEQAYLYADGVIDWAIGALKTDLSKPYPPGSWPLVLPPTPIADGQGKISGIVQDAQGLFNINNFVKTQSPVNTNPQQSSGAGPDVQGAGQSNQNSDSSQNQNVGSSQNEKRATASISDSAKVFVNLLGALQIPLSEQQQQDLIAAITAWVTPQDPAVNTKDPFDQYYSQLNPGYRAPHALMRSVSELRMVQGMTPSMYNRLLPYIVALPGNTSVISQHAPPVMLQALGLQPDTTQQQQQSQGQYFLVRADVYLQDQHLVLYCMLQRMGSTNNANSANNPQGPQVKMLWKSLGTE